MGWFQRSRKADSRLVGKWRIDPDDVEAVQAYGDVAIEFDSEKNLTYIINSDDKASVIMMTHQAVGDTLTTDQPSHPNPQTTKYTITDEGALILTFGGIQARFIRAPADSVTVH